jgi:hypothetical protein
MRLYSHFSHWRSESADAYPNEKFFHVFARCIIADNAREQFDTAFGEGSGRNDAKIPLFFLLAISSFPDQPGRLVTLEQRILENLGKVNIKIKDENGKAVTYKFPSEQETVHIVSEHDPETGFSTSRTVALEGPILKYLSYFMELVDITMGHRVVFFTHQGYLGIGPPNMQEDDVVFIPHGAETPFVLRPNHMPPDIGAGEIWQTLYHVIGECYVHGLMDGEAFAEGSGFSEKDIVLF